MLKLRNRRSSIPNGFLYEQRETGWRNWIVEPTTMWDFDLLCLAIQRHRRANPQFKLNTAIPAIAGEVEMVNVARISAMPNTESYLMEAGSVQPSFLAAPVNSLLQLVADAKAVSAGAKTVLDFEDSGESPVLNEQAEQRAQVCETCPQNQAGDFTRFFTIPVATKIKSQIERAHDMKLSTSHDERLNVCSACLCPLKLKVHFPLSFIVKHMSDEIRGKLDPRCWITHEQS